MAATKIVALNVADASKAFLERAAKSAGCSVAHLVRTAALEFAKEVLSEDPPEVPAVVRGGGRKPSPFAAKATAAGLTVPGYQRMLACTAEGLEFKPRKTESLAYIAEKAAAKEAAKDAPAQG